jgi:hypothetical protein
LSDDFVLANVLNDISNFETGQIRAIDSDIKVLNHVLLTLASVGQIVGNY